MVTTAKIEHKPKVLQAVAPTAPPPPGGNSAPSRDELLFYMGQFAASDKEMQAARRRRKLIRQQAKLANINLEQFDRALKERDRNDNSTLSNLRDFRLYCQYLDLPIGSQFELFDKPQDTKSFSEEARLKRARQTGYEHGVGGQTPDTQAFPEMTPEGQEYMNGWNEGQDVNKQMFLKLNEKIAEEETKKAAGRAAKKKAKDEEEEEGDDEADEDSEAADTAEAAE